MHRSLCSCITCAKSEGFSGRGNLGPPLSQCLCMIRVQIYCFLVPVVDEYVLIACWGLHIIKTEESKLLFLLQLCHYYIYTHMYCRFKSICSCWTSCWSYWDFHGNLPLFSPWVVRVGDPLCYLEKNATKKEIRHNAAVAQHSLGSTMVQGCSLWSWGNVGPCWPREYSPSKTISEGRRNTLRCFTLARLSDLTQHHQQGAKPWAFPPTAPKPFSSLGLAHQVLQYHWEDDSPQTKALHSVVFEGRERPKFFPPAELLLIAASSSVLPPSSSLPADAGSMK